MVVIEVEAEVGWNDRNGNFSLVLKRGEEVPYYREFTPEELYGLEELLKKGEVREDLVYNSVQMGVDDPYILDGLGRLGVPLPEDALKLARKYIEEGELTPEEHRRVHEVVEGLMGEEFVLRWGDRVKWTSEAKRARELNRRRFTYHELMRLTRDELERIAKAKGVPVKGRKEAIARAIEEHDKRRWWVGTVFERYIQEVEEAEHGG